MQRRLLVVGAADGSLGQYIAIEASHSAGWDAIITAGISGDEQWTFDALTDTIPERFTDVVCTVGVNVRSIPLHMTFQRSLEMQMAVNAIAPLRLLDQWLGTLNMDAPDADEGFNFVVVSSNSAHIARSDSAGYCASKAALSMGLRSYARTIARSHPYAWAWGYEPGWLDGTPMSKGVSERLGDLPAHRIPGNGEGINPQWLGAKIVSDMLDSGKFLHGTMQRIDRGEQ